MSDTENSINVLFVCTGNTCRSPMAEAFFREVTAQSSHAFCVQSAGVAASEGAKASGNTQTVLKERAIDCSSFSSQSATEKLLDASDYIFCMTRGHRDTLMHYCPEMEEKVFLLGEFLEEEQASDIVDPFGMNLEAYRYVAEQLDVALPNVLEFIESSLEEK